MGRVRICCGVLICLCVAACATTARAQELVSAWAEFTGSGISLRAIASGAECPIASVDGKALVMTVREAVNSDFPVSVCQAAAPAGGRFATVGGRRLALAPRRLKRIVVIGDTGCRLKGELIQECNDAKKWPFSTMTTNAAAKHPDLVIHVGDYYYRETACPAERPGCNGSPHGNRWDSWQADFFSPASNLLSAAPWIFARGNHEQCGRGAEGWFRFLDAGATPLTCPATAAPFQVSFDRLKIQVIDTADVVDKQLSTDRLAFYQTQLDAIPGAAAGKPSEETWVVTHKPLWGYELSRTGANFVAQNRFLATAASMMDKPRAAQMPGVDLLLAGHIHLFGAIDFSSGASSLRPAQLIVGDSGTALDAADVRTGEAEVDGLVAKFTVRDVFGYMVLDRTRKGWSGRLYSAEDAVLATCKQHGRQIGCQEVAK